MKRLLITCALCACLCAQSYDLMVRNGTICYRESGGAWHDTGLCAQAVLPAQDDSLLSRGLHFPTRQALTRALEDFCS